MGVIHQLERSVYNRISAGEVVENPASVVKELVENAIDASATEVTVSIENGGIKSISVVDNGCGMEEEDLQNCILPHATSKIYDAEDLLTISTLGFRGEALASICAVSKTEIKSHYAQDTGAHFVAVEGGEIVDEGDSTLQKGTTITVSSLFYNTPARYKFLKTPKGEESSVTKLMKDLIISNPEIVIRYVVDGTVQFASDGNGIESAVCTVFGAAIHDCMIPFYQKEKGYTLRGFTARPATDAIKGNRSNQILVVNGRTVEDAAIQAVIANAYGDALMKRTFPSFVLDIVMPFDEVDVNVHPNKREVRFAESKKLCGLVYSVIKRALEEDEENRRQEMTATFSERKVIPTIPVYVPEIKPDPAVEEAERKKAEEEAIARRIRENQKAFRQNKDAKCYDTPLDLSKLLGDLPPITEESYYCPPVLFFSDSEEEVEKEMHVIGQAFKTYILVECEDVVYWIDQHAAHERILFDQFVKQTKEKVAMQELLFPCEVLVNEQKAEFFAENVDSFSALGFAVAVEDSVIKISAVLSVLGGMDVEKFIIDVDCRREINDFGDLSVLRDKLAQTACKNAIKGGDALSDDQIKYFLKDYLEKMPLQCPHGRPTVIRFEKKEIEKMFGRIV